MDARLDRYVDVSSFAADVLGVASASQAVVLFKSMLAKFGYEAFFCGESTNRDPRQAVCYVVELPDEFATKSLGHIMMADCRLLGAMANLDVPKSWSDMDHQQLHRAGIDSFKEAADSYGWDVGLFVPLSRGGSRKGLIGLLGRSSTTATADRSLVAALSMVFYERVRGMLAGTPGLVDCAGLTQREIGCMRYVADGLPDAAIAEKMETSQTEINVLVHSARMRLGARTRAEAVAIVVSLGLVVI